MTESNITTNVLYCGDCKDILKKVPDESIDLIYLDPPFFSRKEYENFWIKDKVTTLKFSDKDWEELRHSIDPVILKEYEEIEERWKSGHKGIYVYIAYMRERVEQCWRVLKSTGILYLHCDWHAGHYLKVMMDGVFGYNNLLNEIVWCYETAGKSKKWFSRKHDTILLYRKSQNYFLDVSRSPMPRKRNKHMKIGIDENGREYEEKTDAKTRKVYRWYFDEGRLPFDYWTDINFIYWEAKERLGYPTQKPEALLERIIKVFTNEGNIVLDPFCGCGTTLIVAERLNRRWVGIDISRAACDVVKNRLKGHVTIIGGETEEELKTMNPHEFARLLIVEKLEGTISPRKSGDMGIDGWVEFMQVPVQVKRWGHKVGRPEIDKFKTAIERQEKKKGMVIAFDFSRDSWEEVARIKDKDGLEIQLKTVKEILSEE